MSGQVNLEKGKHVKHPSPAGGWGIMAPPSCWFFPVGWNFGSHRWDNICSCFNKGFSKEEKISALCSTMNGLLYELHPRISSSSDWL